MPRQTADGDDDALVNAFVSGFPQLKGKSTIRKETALRSHRQKSCQKCMSCGPSRQHRAGRVQQSRIFVGNIIDLNIYRNGLPNARNDSQGGNN